MDKNNLFKSGNNNFTYCSSFFDWYDGSYRDRKRKLILKRNWDTDDLWKIIPDCKHDDYVIINKFENTFPKGVNGTKEECLKIIENYVR